MILAKSSPIFSLKIERNLKNDLFATIKHTSIDYLAREIDLSDEFQQIFNYSIIYCSGIPRLRRRMVEKIFDKENMECVGENKWQ